MELFPDKTIFIQVALFIAFWMVFKHVVVAPTMRVLAERDRRTVQARHAADETSAAAQAEQVRYDQAVYEQRLRMSQEAEAARHAAIEESNREIGTARANIAYELGHRRDAVAKQVEEARRALGAEAEQVAAEMLRRVSGSRA
jgi:F0F1-type ATP synthase membrane subunit b/b'